MSDPELVLARRERRLTFEQFAELVGPDVCGCDALEGEARTPVGWVPCPASCCDRPDHEHSS